MEELITKKANFLQNHPCVAGKFCLASSQFQIKKIYQFQTLILQAAAGRKIHFKLGKKSSLSDWKFQTGEFKKASSDR